MSKKATIIAVVNQKGGTGKTTTTENLGVGLALEGKKVLLVDTDPQASLTVSLGNPCPDDLSPTLSDLMGKIMMENPITPDEGILHHPEGVDLVPSNIELSGMEVALVNAMSRETILRQYLDTVKQNYDYILLDCMPSLGMVDANLQRESILPSERAFAYKMKLDAIKHQGQRTDLTSSQVGMKLQAMDIVGQEAGESRNQVHRYIRLTELIPELLDMVDTGQIKFNPAVELSYLASEEQKDFLSAMDYAQAAPSLSQAQRIKKLAQEGECTLDAMCEIMNEIKKGELDRVTFKTDSLRKYFPKSYTNKQMEDKIIQLLEQWQKKREKSMER
ncbi:hypothetical protein I250019C1_06580 [Faecalibacterium sp. i25-0019-C1]|uniref:AAA family ATPase n=1 Tax=Faecalibacterium sp. i25-0019-C1 TaxID=3141185 RepID=UPI0036F1D45E